MDAKKKEAEENLAKGDERVKTTLTRWKPDWNGSIDFYDRAALCFKNCQMKQKAIEAYTKLANSHDHLGTFSSAGKAFESAATLTDSVTDNVAFLEKAAACYRRADTSERTIEMLVKAGKLLENTDVPRATKLMLDACEICEEDQKYSFARDHFIGALNFMIRNKDYTNGITILQRLYRILEVAQLPQGKGRTQLSIIILHLGNEDFAAADAAYNDMVQNQEFSSRDEWYVATDLMFAYENGSQEALDKVKTSSALQAVETCIMRVAKDLKITKGPQTRSTPFATPTNFPGEEMKDENDIL
jgi:tetratricopeptide (TPR) repeat protein